MSRNIRALTICLLVVWVAVIIVYPLVLLLSMLTAFFLFTVYKKQTLEMLITVFNEMKKEESFMEVSNSEQ